MFCPKCGNAINDNENFCPYCGTQIATNYVTAGNYQQNTIPQGACFQDNQTQYHSPGTS